MSKPTVADALRTSVEIPASDALYLARAGVAAASKDDVTPVITGVLLSATDDAVKIVSTDRYRIHRAIVTVEGVGSFDPILIPSKALRWLIANTSFFGRGMLPPIVTFDATRTSLAERPPAGGLRLAVGTLTITIRENSADDADFLSYKTDLINGSFPIAVERLLDEALLQEADTTDDAGTIDLDFLAGCRALAGNRYEKPHVRFVPAPDGARAKVGRVLVSFKQGQALIQKATEV